LTAPYEERNEWEMNVMSVEGTLYFEEHLTEARLREKYDFYFFSHFMIHGCVQE
jgi:RAT1-interacting protein